MTTNTNFNTAPYYDDFDEDKNFHRVLFRPSVPVQARELTQSQTILQNQIERFGKHVFIEGSVVEGCALSFDNRYNYVKITDNYGNGASVVVTDLIDKVVEANTGTRALVVNAIDGLEPQAPDLKTLYLKYVNTGRYANGMPEKRFTANSVLTVYSVNEDDSLVETGTVNVDGANTAAAVGVGYAVSVSEGVIFQKGFFIRVEPQTTVVTKYKNFPHLVSVGFQTQESIVTPEADETLLDNALGSPNYTAPGAHRLKLTPVLTSRPTGQVSNTSSFFSLADFSWGTPVSIRVDPQYANLGKEFAKRTYEESGDYLTDPFIVTSTDLPAAPNLIRFDVDAGSGYVQGFRVQQLGRRSLNVRKGTNIKTVNSATLTASMGNYVVANEVAGGWNFVGLGTVQLANSPVLAVSNSANTANLLSFAAPTGNTIGTATIKAIEYNNNTPGQANHQVRLYLTNIKMNTGRSFQDVKSVYANGAGALRAVADVVLNSGKAELQETNLDTLVFPTGKKALRDLKDSANATITEFTFRQGATLSVNTTGGTTLTHSIAAPGGTEELTFGTGQISDAAVRANFLIVANTGADAANQGTVAGTGSNVTGTGTAFLSQYPGNTGYIKVFQSANASQTEVRLVTSVANDTFLTVTPAWTHAHAAGNVTCRTFPAGSVINPPSINVISATAATINVAANTSTPTAFSVTTYYPVKRTVALPKQKVINKNRFVRIAATTGVTNADINTRSIYLGLPDVVKIRNIYLGNSSNHSNTNLNVTSQFVFDSGQRDDFYGLASIRLKPEANVDLSNTAAGNSGLLVELDHFTHSEASGAGFLSIESYPIDDANTANTNAITTAEIPIFYSPTDGSATDLRDALDFRPIVANTVVSTTVIGSSNVITGAAILSPTMTFSPSVYGPLIPRTDTNIYAAFSFYIGRKVKIAIDPQGILSVINGVPSDFPVTPRDKDGALTIANVYLPPYPTLSQAQARTYNRPDYSITIEMQKNRRYTMRDIGAIADRVSTLEYYTSLSLLEKAASDLLITDGAGIERFKNGFLVEPFRGFDIADTTDSEFRIAIDAAATEARPRAGRRQVGLVYRSALSNNTVQVGNTVSFPYTHVTYLDQPYSTKVRNCVEGLIYEWKGNVELSPEGDYAVDENRNADVVIDLDLASNWLNLADAWPTSWGDWRTTASQITGISTSTQTAINQAAGTVGLQTTITAQTSDTQVRTGSGLSATVTNNSYYAGDYITDISIQPYIRRRAVKFRVTSLKPNTILTPFFDDVNVSQYVYAIPSPTPNTTLRDVDDLELDLQRPGQRALTISEGGQLVTDQFGIAYGIFYIPDGIFRTGERVFTLADVDDLIADADAITTIASATYSGSNFSISKSKLSLNTREAQVAQSTVSQQRVVTNSTTHTNETVVGTRQSGDQGDLWRQLVDQGLATAALGEAFHNIGWWDPIAQTFMINEVPSEVPGIYVTKVDVFFQTKDPTFGIELQLREVVNGFPTSTIVPFSRVVKRANQVAVSGLGGTIATTFEFKSPVFLQSGKEYAMVIIPNGNSNKYRIWCSELGGVDRNTGVQVSKNLGAGVLLVSSTNRIWTPYQKEDLKFKLYRAEYTALSGNIVFTNGEAEYLTYGNNVGNFIPGEKIYQSNGISSANGNTTSTSTTVFVGPGGPNAQTAFATGNKIFLANTITSEIKTVSAVINSTAFTLTTNADITAANSLLIGKIKGNGNLVSKVLTIGPRINFLHTINSTANSTVLYTNNALVFGDTSGAYANVESVDNFEYSVTVPQLADLTPSGTSIDWFFTGYSNNNVADTTPIDITEGVENENTDFMRKMFSRSNELSTISGNRSLRIIGVANSVVNKISPIVDDIKNNVILIRNLINTQASTLNETTTRGNALSKYISKQVVLADGQDAEDFKAFIAAYQPQGTNVQVYGKFLHREDPDTFKEKSWTLLTRLTPPSVYSVTSNRNDLREFEYGLPSTNAAATTAYLDPINGITYTNKDGATFQGYKTFAIKIVLQSDVGPHLVPRVSDLRAIALQL